MNFQSVNQASSFGWFKGFVQRSRRMRVQVIHHQHDLLGVWVVNVDQVFDDLREINSSPLVGDNHFAPPTNWFIEHEQSTDPIPLIFVIETRWPTTSHRHRDAFFTYQLKAGLVQADLWPTRIVGPHVDVEHVLHMKTNSPLGAAGRQYCCFSQGLSWFF